MLNDKYIQGRMANRRLKRRAVYKGPRALCPGKLWENVPLTIKEQLLSFFPEIEIYFNDGKYHLYRLIGKKNGNDDIMIHEMTFSKMSHNLVPYLLKHDSYRKYGKDNAIAVNQEVDEGYKKRDERNEMIRNEGKETLIKAYELGEKNRIYG